MKLAFVYTAGRLRRLQAVRAGQAPSEFFYGAVQLERRGHQIEYLELPSPAPGGLLRRVADRGAAARLTPCRVNGTLLDATASLLPALRSADTVVATTSGIALSLWLWRSAGRLRRPIAAIQCGLVNHEHNAVRRGWTGRLLRGMWSVLYGQAELPAMRAVFDLHRDCIRVAPFGVDTAFWAPGEQPRRDFVFALGNDGRRDFHSLLAGADRIRLPIRLLTRLALPAPLPTGVERILGRWSDGVDDVELRELYRHAACVAIPLLDALQPSGQSVCLQAMACGTPVVLTRTRGLWDPELIRDEETALLVPPRDVDALVDAVNRLCQDDGLAGSLSMAAQRMVRAHATIEGFADGIETVVHAAIGGGQSK